MRIATMILAGVLLAGGIAPAAAKTSGSAALAAQSTRASNSIPASKSNVKPGDSNTNNGHKGHHGPPLLSVCSNASSNGVNSANCKGPVSPQ